MTTFFWNPYLVLVRPSIHPSIRWAVSVSIIFFFLFFWSPLLPKCLNGPLHHHQQMKKKREEPWLLSLPMHLCVRACVFHWFTFCSFILFLCVCSILDNTYTLGGLTPSLQLPQGGKWNQVSSAPAPPSPLFPFGCGGSPQRDRCRGTDNLLTTQLISALTNFEGPTIFSSFFVVVIGGILSLPRK